MADQSTAEALAAHQRWEWRATMCERWRGKRHTVLAVTSGGRCVHLIESDNGFVRVSPYRDGDTVARPAGCQCQWEEGDSPCPVHGDDAADGGAR